MSKDESRRNFFSLYSDNLSLHADKLPNRFVSPICFEVFDESACNPPLAVDIAHIYPNAAGGRAETLTCRKCNNDARSIYDSQLVQAHRSYRALRRNGSGSVDGRIP
jgi:hypothetical protein